MQDYDCPAQLAPELAYATHTTLHAYMETINVVDFFVLPSLAISALAIIVLMLNGFIFQPLKERRKKRLMKKRPDSPTMCVTFLNHHLNH